jgi:uncharacterized protein (DUF697 family)
MAKALGHDTGATVLYAMPRNPRELEEAAARCKKLVTKRAAMASASSLIPLPGLDIAADIGLLMELIPQINKEFGLTPEQIGTLNPQKQLMVYKAIVALGGAMVGKLVTKEIIVHALKAVGVRLTVKQAAKYVPLAGQALAATLGFAAMKYIGHQHIKDCSKVVETVNGGAK